MRDDGQGGDAIAGDGIFTALETITPGVAGPVSFRASARYRDLGARSYSDTVILTASAPLTADQTLQGIATAFNNWDLATASAGFAPTLASQLGIRDLSRANASRIGSCMAGAKLSRDGSAFRAYACDYIGADGKVTLNREFSLALQDDGRWLVVAW
jgi:hypothetical protein